MSKATFEINEQAIHAPSGVHVRIIQDAGGSTVRVCKEATQPLGFDFNLGDYCNPQAFYDLPRGELLWRNRDAPCPHCYGSGHVCAGGNGS